jgi:hypothetical protein
LQAAGAIPAAFILAAFAVVSQFEINAEGVG